MAPTYGLRVALRAPSALARVLMRVAPRVARHAHEESGRFRGSWPLGGGPFHGLLRVLLLFLPGLGAWPLSISGSGPDVFLLGAPLPPWSWNSPRSLALDLTFLESALERPCLLPWPPCSLGRAPGGEFRARGVLGERALLQPWASLAFSSASDLPDPEVAGSFAAAHPEEGSSLQDLHFSPERQPQFLRTS